MGLHRSTTRPRRAVLVAAVTIASTVAPACTSSTSNDVVPAAGSLVPIPGELATSTSSTSTTRPPEPSCRPPAELTEPRRELVPAELADVLAERVADTRFAAVAFGASVWMEGYGEVLAPHADVPLLPASNQKLLTGLGALVVLPHDGTFLTEVRSTGTIEAGVLTGDLTLIGGGDPTLTRSGAHSLDELARQVYDAGLREVKGTVVADESRQESTRTATGWQDWQIPTYAGPLSALTVDDNRYRTDDAYLAQPAIGNTEAFVDALRRHGVTVEGTVLTGTTPEGAALLASATSRPFPELVADMLLRSDNETAEMLVREIGLRAAASGTTAAGVRVVEAELESALCIELVGQSGDGSGLSRADFRSARELRIMFQAALASPWGTAIDAALPVGARTGTLAGRFAGTAAAGNVRAKTGSIIGGRALTGHLRTAGGREVVFSVLVNGEGSPAAQHAIDALIITLADDTS